MKDSDEDCMKSISEADRVNVAYDYFKNSNEHHLDSIEKMLSSEIIYTSNGVGSYVGRESVMSMMTGFFNKFPDVKWIVRDVSSQKENFSVVLRFEMHLTTTSMPLSGTEIITIDLDGKISQINVTRDLSNAALDKIKAVIGGFERGLKERNAELVPLHSGYEAS